MRIRFLKRIKEQIIYLKDYFIKFKNYFWNLLTPKIRYNITWSCIIYTWLRTVKPWKNLLSWKSFKVIFNIQILLLSIDLSQRILSLIIIKIWYCLQDSVFKKIIDYVFIFLRFYFTFGQFILLNLIEILKKICHFSYPNFILWSFHNNWSFSPKRKKYKADFAKFEEKLFNKLNLNRFSSFVYKHLIFNYYERLFIPDLIWDLGLNKIILDAKFLSSEESIKNSAADMLFRNYNKVLPLGERHLFLIVPNMLRVSSVNKELLLRGNPIFVLRENEINTLIPVIWIFAITTNLHLILGIIFLSSII